MKLSRSLVLSVAALLALPTLASASVEDLSALHPRSGGGAMDMAFLFVASALVFMMQAGFAMLETGFCRAKNAVAVLMKNVSDFAVGVPLYVLVGFGLMFGGLSSPNGFFGTNAFGLSGTFTPEGAAEPIAISSDSWSFSFLLFQTMFAATAATIVSGALAERTRFRAYLIFSGLMTCLIYPIFGSWAWGGLFLGGGWLEARPGGILEKLGLPGFIDFAGSTVVHSIGGWAALAGAMVVGPRIGKFARDRVNPIPGHSLPLATLGMFLLVLGWFGFNAGSKLTVSTTIGATGVAAASIAQITLNTILGAVGGLLGSMATSWIKVRKPDPGLTINGALAGLVSVTAGCANIAPWAAFVAGVVGGAIVVFAVLFIDRLRIDDPVGAISVHALCGVWGTLAAGLFDATGTASIATQAIGVVVAFLWSFPLSFIAFKILAATVGLRVSADDEDEGLDLSEHAAVAYFELEMLYEDD